MNPPGDTPSRVKIGHIRLKVNDLDRSVAFFTRILHMKEVERAGSDYVFLGAGEAHHDLALLRVPGEVQSTRSPEAPGFDHVAFEISNKQEYARAYLALTDAGIAVRAIDNGISWSLYFSDPEGNQIEMFCDTRREPGGRMLWEGRAIELASEAIMAALENEP